MSADHGARIVALQQVMHEQHLDGLLLAGLPNVRYLTGFSGSNAVFQNSGWSASPDAAAIATAAVRVGAFAFAVGSQDAALLVTLAPGAYTAQVTGVGGTTGLAILEIYELP